MKLVTGIAMGIVVVAVSIFVWSNELFYITHPGRESMQYEGEILFPDTQTTVTKEGIVRNPESLLVLVNKQRRLPSSYVPPDLVIPNVRFSFNGDKEKMKLRKEAAKELAALFQAGEKQGIYLFVVSAYRSYDRQKSLYTMYQQKEGKEIAAASSAVAGTSEHQTGLAVDISAQSTRFLLDVSFATTKEGQWLQENAHKFGFIIRYPEHKEEITGYTYEPWHIRYVGEPHARYLYERRLTLEEVM
ncbi:M15 family metallopeptidase [Ectobacillus antri]|jgi:LAS superfamily LD-carboxypeptidase LdcB|uniref:M15 family metallopeptidase n=1 Tax=Ectobacillus antri TaxID=2486280 RepID=A0ABT6H143_9BACI|nr:M15 family metallopeptidase [Ectobacillus antri]MDG4656278.1 M15 family metallopeptidase [Ectobacillus antri]MDG5752953.1 M15 family metallopeptidase [Ectobacillus antri]